MFLCDDFADAIGTGRGGALEKRSGQVMRGPHLDDDGETTSSIHRGNDDRSPVPTHL